MAETPGSLSRSGRVRKKSAKLLEMEDIDELEAEVRMEEKLKAKKIKTEGMEAFITEKKLAPLKLFPKPTNNLMPSPHHPAGERKSRSPKKIKEQRDIKHQMQPASGLSALDLLAAGGLMEDETKGMIMPHYKKSSSGEEDVGDLDISVDDLDEEPHLVIAESVHRSSKKIKKEPMKVNRPMKDKPKMKIKSSPIKKIKEEMFDDDDEDADHYLAMLDQRDTLDVRGPSMDMMQKKVKKQKPGAVGKDKKKARITAYMLWCRENRKRIVAETPHMDFASISRRLGEVWTAQSDKEKLAWRRKAKRMAKAVLGSNMINTGKEATKNYTAAANKAPVLKNPYTVPSGITKLDLEHPSKDMFKVVGTAPIDVAAHLSLLGESLSIIGQRLTEHEGQIAVSGSLSVLLDSTLCALGPLLCLTNQVPEFSGCNKESLCKVLDNIAYIMPGL